MLPMLRAAERAAREPPPRTTWQIKVGTLCNLRCRYCYEWDRLGDRGRLTLQQWRKVFEAVEAHRYRRMRDTGENIVTTIVWHGGEPALHSPEYVEAVLELQRDVLGETTGPNAVRNAVQTNLTRVSETLALMVEAGFVMSVSADFAAGVRVDAAGRDSDAPVRSNLERILAGGATCGVALALGRHNADRLEDVYDTLADMGAAWLNVIPLFTPPAAAPLGDLMLPPEDVVNALDRLFVHSTRCGSKLPVQPLRSVLRTALQRRSVRPAQFDEAHRSHVRLVVQPDGTLTDRVAAKTRERLGNVFTASMDEIMRSHAWQAAADRHVVLRMRHCANCAYRDACDGKPVLDQPHIRGEGPCSIVSALCARVEARLEDAGVVAIDEGVW
jgi:uncharacterized protein